MSNIILYTIDCPKCIVLENKLKDKNINFETVKDENTLKSLGLDVFPVLKVDNEMLQGIDAIKWVNSQKGC